MAKTYTELVDSIHLYTNRDEKVIPYALAKQFIDFSTNDIYNKLRIPPLEAIINFGAATADGNLVPIPEDLIEFIQFRQLDSVGRVDKIYENRADIKSFYLSDVSKFNTHYYTRETTSIVIFPDFETGDEFQLVYYRRLPAVYSRDAVTKGNFDTDLVYFSAVSKADLESIVDTAEPNARVRDPDISDKYIREITAPDTDFPDLSSGFYLGKLSQNWVRDDQQSLVLHGALAEAYGYLHDTAKQERYIALFQEGIAEENREARLRTVRGGTAQTHFSSKLL
jgi:hypothetical protein